MPALVDRDVVVDTVVDTDLEALTEGDAAPAAASTSSVTIVSEQSKYTSGDVADTWCTSTATTLIEPAIRFSAVSGTVTEVVSAVVTLVTARVDASTVPSGMFHRVTSTPLMYTTAPSSIVVCSTREPDSARGVLNATR